MTPRRILGRALQLLALLLALSFARALWQEAPHVVAVVTSHVPVLLAIAGDALAARYLLSKRPWRHRDALPIAATGLFSLAALLFLAAVAYVDVQLERHPPAHVLPDCSKVWAARGLVPEGRAIVRHTGTQNSIESVGRAFDHGALGSEVDVYYDVDLGGFVVSHDRNPYNLKGGRLLMLAELFEALGERGSFWLDLKKLRHLNAEDLRACVAHLERITAGGDLKQRVWVEGEDPLNLSAFRDAGFHTILDSHPLTDDNPLTPFLIDGFKLVYWFGGYSVFAMNYGEPDDPIYGERTRRSLGNVPVFLYHVEDDRELLEDLTSLDAVRVILVVDQSVARYDVNACP